MSFKQYTVAVEQDGISPGKYLIAIYGDKKLVGVPLRGASKRHAEECVDVVRFAFEFGWLACDSVTREFMRTTWLQVRQVSNTENKESP